MPRFLDVDAVLRLHHEQIETFGGSEGIRDQGLLESALGAAEQNFGYTGDLHQAGAQYLLSIARNHPFVDGNKRTGLACALVFLDLNDRPVEVEGASLFDAVLAAATGNSERDNLAAFLLAQ